MRWTKVDLWLLALVGVLAVCLVLVLGCTAELSTDGFRWEIREVWGLDSDHPAQPGDQPAGVSCEKESEKEVVTSQPKD